MQSFLTETPNPTWHLPKTFRLLDQTVPDCRSHNKLHLYLIKLFLGLLLDLWDKTI